MSSPDTSLLPLYHRVFLVMREKLLAGLYPDNEMLPGELQLAAEYSVSRATIRKALALLDAEGLITRRQGAGTWPRMSGRSGQPRQHNLELIRQGDGYYRDVFHGDVETLTEEIPVDDGLRDSFGEFERVVRIARRRSVGGKPHSYIVSFLPPDVAARLPKSGPGNEPLIGLLYSAGFRPVSVAQSLSATTADERLAGAFGVPLGAALLKVSGLFIDAQGRCLMRKDGYFLADSYRYETTVLMRAP